VGILVPKVTTPPILMDATIMRKLQKIFILQMLSNLFIIVVRQNYVSMELSLPEVFLVRNIAL
jgi:hypothetical protein